MTFINNVIAFIKEYFSIPSINVTDIIEMLILAVIIYEIMAWFKRTRAWALFKGIIIIVIVVILADLLQFNTILWLASKIISVLIIAIVVIFQPELRRALEQLGRGKLFRNVFNQSKEQVNISPDSADDIVEAVAAMAQAHTGALICIERDVTLSEYVSTGIKIDSAISSQLLVNIFEDKTPLHDGAVLIRDNRIVAATCYLPMSASKSLDKRYGTRHRAALGISEVSDAFTIVVSEETGQISITELGEMTENVSVAALKNKIFNLMPKEEEKKGIFALVRKNGKNGVKEPDEG